jgi:hypothetical protein
MKLYWRQNVYGWVMTGLVGKKARWFFGFSRVPSPAQRKPLP